MLTDKPVKIKFRNFPFKIFITELNNIFLVCTFNLKGGQLKNKFFRLNIIPVIPDGCLGK